MLSRRSERLLVDAHVSPGAVGAAFAALDFLGRDPVAICAWWEDGTLVDGFPLNLAAWLAVAPNYVSGYTGAGEAIWEPSTSWRDLHGWEGWPEKQSPI